MLEVDSLCTGYGRLAVLHDVSIDVPLRRVTGLLGANGAGKTTLLSAIMGFLPAWSGEIRLGDMALTRFKPHAIARRGVTLVPQGRELFGGMTVRENLDVAGLRCGDGRLRARRLDEQLDLFPRLRERLDQRAQTLSGGEQQMLAIARALMVGPKVLLLDEPTMGLAPRVISDLANVIRALNAQGQTILLVEQNLGLITATTQYVYVLRNGRKVFEGETRALHEDRDTLKLYLE